MDRRCAMASLLEKWEDGDQPVVDKPQPKANGQQLTVNGQNSLAKPESLHPVHQTHDGYFNTVSGKKVSINNPTESMIEIRDIAHALSKLCRFGGHTSSFYSVAQHSYLVYRLAHYQNEPSDILLAALMHDATEAYCQDVIKPLKNIIGTSYEVVESRFEAIISSKFNIPLANFHYIKKYDKQALEIEHNYFFKKEPSTMMIMLPPVHYAAIAFLNMFTYLTKQP